MARRTSRRQSAKHEPPRCLYLGCFHFDEPGEPEQSGSFQLVVEASSPEQAIDRCRSHIRRLRTDLFDDPITIYIEGIIKLAGSFKDGLIVNWESGENSSFRLTALLPEPEGHPAEGFGFGNEPKDGETTAIEPFVDFGGIKFREARRASAGAVQQTASRISYDQSRPRRPVTPTVPSTTEVARPQGADAKAMADAKRKRREALASTLAELAPSKAR